jgi:hypothetical protein
MKIKLLFLTLLFSAVSWGQITEGFESGLPVAYTTGTFALGSGSWTGTNVIKNTVATNLNSGLASCQLKSAVGAQITSPNMTTGVGVATFWAKGSTATGAMQVNYSTDAGVTWVAATGSPFTLTTTMTQYTATINNSSPNILVQFYRTAAVVYLDDINITVSSGCTAPAITTQPSVAGQTVCQGVAATALTVVASGTAPTYQWYSNTTASNAGGTSIALATTNSYTPPTATAGTTYYYCVVTGTCGSVTSNVSGAITVNAVPANPTGSITVSANPSCGPATLSYPAGSYWQTTAGGTSTASPTSGTYPVSVTGTTVYVRNFNGTCWSTGAINSGAITVNTPVAITTQPTDSAIYSGSNTTFSVAATGTSLSYQWQVNTGSGFTNLTNVAPYSNVTTATMNITAATVGMNGYLYRCIVSGAAPCASVTSSSALLTVTLYVPAGTVLKPGDLVFVGYDSTAHATCAGADDRFYIATLVDVLPGTQFLVVNSRYESGAAANVRTDRWYGSGSPVYEDPGILTFTWTGAGSLPAGSIISFVSNSTVPAYTSVSNVRVNDVLEPLLTAAGSYYPCNISSNDPDQIYIMQGLFTPFGVIGTDRYNTFTGRVLYGLTNGRAWVPFTSAVSAGTGGGSTRESRLPDEIECFNIESTSLNGVRFYNNSSLHTGTKNQLLSALNTVANWTIPANTNCLNVVEDFSGVTGVAVGKPFVITIGNPDGTWTGASDTDWFKCANWEGLAVPKATDDVIIPATPVNQPIIGASPLKYPIGAFSNNLTLNNGSTLGMPNASSRLNLYANWTNNSGSANFSEGLGTVYFEGSTPQIINAVTPEGTETFHHLVLNNDFTTSVSNDIIANGNLTVGVGKTLIVSANDYVQVTNNVTNNGTFNILNSGSLVQINDAGVNSGNNISMKRTANQRLYDYIYWSSPVANFPVTNVSPTTSPSYIYKWETLATNANGGQGNWINTSENMALGKGYIVRGASAFNNTTATSWTADFVGIPNNGIVPVTLSRGTNLPSVSVFDDNWSLIGNPYPSAIDADSFINRFGNPAFPAEYKDIEGSVRIWTHNTLPANIASPFYQNFVLNYTPNDYITYNSLGSQTGPATFNGKIAAGQSFLVLRNDGAANATTLNFDNALRSRLHNNSQFFRQSNVSNTSNAGIEKHRIWIDLVSPTNAITRTLVGYVEGATLAKDNTFDAFTDYKNATNFYSLIGAQPVIIQGRPTPFDVNDRVSMGIKIPTNGTYTIAIAAVDGLFSGNAQKIYIEDKLLNTINDITVSPYQFTATQGITNDRFVLRYTNQALSTTDHDLANNAVTVFASTAGISINSSTESIKDYTVYNVLGQTLAEKNNVNANQSVVNTIAKNNQALIVKIVLTNGQAIIKKVIF